MDSDEDYDKALQQWADDGGCCWPECDQQTSDDAVPAKQPRKQFGGHRKVALWIALVWVALHGVTLIASGTTTVKPELCSVTAACEMAVPHD